MSLVSQSEFARRMGVTPATINQAIKKGILKITYKDGVKLMNYEEEKSAYLRSRRTRKPGPKNSSNGSVDGINDQNDYEYKHLGDVKIRNEALKARKAQIELNQLEGKIIEIAIVQKLFSDLGSNLKKSILSIPDRIGPLLAGENDPHKCKMMLKSELLRSLKNMVEEAQKSKVENVQFTPGDLNPENVESEIISVKPIKKERQGQNGSGAVRNRKGNKSKSGASGASNGSKNRKRSRRIKTK